MYSRPGQLKNQKKKKKKKKNNILEKLHRLRPFSVDSLFSMGRK